MMNKPVDKQILYTDKTPQVNQILVGTIEMNGSPVLFRSDKIVQIVNGIDGISVLDTSGQWYQILPLKRRTTLFTTDKRMYHGKSQFPTPDRSSRKATGNGRVRPLYD